MADKLKKGFTTGSCSAAAAKAAAYMLLSGNIKKRISIETPAGIIYTPAIEDISMEEKCVSCAVRKDGGDDPDITSGSLIYAKVFMADKSDDNNESESKVIIDGGFGVGRVTRKGLDQPVGNAAINSVPRKMIESEVMQIMDLFDYDGKLKVVISVPDGDKLAEKTFNPRLGIEGGISIIGTSGIVEPMSTRAILDTIRVELNQLKEEGNSIAIISPGNYGLDFMKNTYGYNLDRAVKCSNYIGDAIDIIRELSFEKILLTGHIGKLIKLSGGIMNTHSKEADSRMELMAAAAVKSGASIDIIDKILNCVTTEEAYKYILDNNLKEEFSKYLMERISFYLNKRSGDIQAECIVYSNEYGLIGATKEAEALLIKVKGECNG